MIITNLIGGLGNQMFQYATARGLSLSKSVDLRLDLRDFARYRLHNGFELHRVFNVSAQAASDAELRSVLSWRSKPIVFRSLRRCDWSWLRGPRFIVEPSLTYWESVMNVPDDCYLTGYWQSEKYFMHIAPTIRADFSFKESINLQNQLIAEDIGNSNAVSVHVRRGDYAANPVTLATHGLCSPDYYCQAMHYVAERVESPIFYIFSDDIPWVKKNVPINFRCHYVEHNRGSESYNDMRLAALCRHHIIANSSFSWWGAWLNPRSEKIVVAPKKWFATEIDATDLLPQDWVRL